MEWTIIDRSTYPPAVPSHYLPIISSTLRTRRYILSVLKSDGLFIVFWNLQLRKIPGVVVDSDYSEQCVGVWNWAIVLKV